MTSWQRTELSTLLGIEYPIVQGPFGGFSTVELTAAVSNAGGLNPAGLAAAVRSLAERLGLDVSVAHASCRMG